VVHARKKNIIRQYTSDSLDYLYLIGLGPLCHLSRKQAGCILQFPKDPKPTQGTQGGADSTVH